MSISILNDPKVLNEFIHACDEIGKSSNTTPPLRNGKQECRVYIRTGVCSFGPTCKHDHPLKTCWSVKKLLQHNKNEYQNEKSLTNLKDFIAYIKRFVVILPGIRESITDQLLILLNNCLMITQELIHIQSSLISLSENHYIFHLNIINELIPLLVYSISKLYKYNTIEVNELLENLSLNCKTWKDNELQLNINITTLLSSNQDDFVIGLNQCIIAHCESKSIDDTIETREHVRLELLDYINKTWIDKDIGVQLIMFGSSSSNLGSLSSDIDLSLNFNTFPVPNQVGKEKIISSSSDDVLPILILEDIMHYIKLENEKNSLKFIIKELVTQTRVPVLKLVHKETNIDIDICIGNTLAIENTTLLRNYSLFDDRVRPLILAIKHWAKKRGVNDPTNSTLTSYAWVLKVIFFLQYACKPAVLPNLQSTTNEIFEKLNTSTIEDLFIQFFLYYGTASINSFDPYIHVCSIKNAHPVIKKSAKLLHLYEPYIQDLALLPNDANSNGVADNAITSWKISIEDPLEEHDLGRVIHSIEGQIHLTTELRRAVGLIQNHLMKKDKNTNIWDELCKENDLIPSILFTCRFCNNTGHTSKECPLNVCNFCGREGHFAKDCPNFKCHLCGDSGHKIKDCPLKRANGNNNNKNRLNRVNNNNNNSRDNNNLFKFNNNDNNNTTNNNNKNERINNSRSTINTNIKSIHNDIFSKTNKKEIETSDNFQIKSTTNTNTSNIDSELSRQRKPINKSIKRSNVNVTSNEGKNVKDSEQIIPKVSILKRLERPDSIPLPSNQSKNNTSRTVTILPPTPPVIEVNSRKKSNESNKNNN